MFRTRSIMHHSQLWWKLLRSRTQVPDRRQQQLEANELPSWVEETLEYYHAELDESANLENIPPSEELIAFNSVWVVECYSPTQLPELLLHLHELGWAGAQARSVEEMETIDEWIEKERQLPYGGAWLNLGTILRLEDRSPRYVRSRTTPLPDEVEYAYASLHHFLPSVFMIVIEFVIDDYHSRRVDALLRKPLASVPTMIGSQHTIASPTWQKKEAVQDIRRSIRVACISWIMAQIPGGISRRGDSDSFPVCEFMTTDVIRPFAPAQTTTPDSYIWIMELDRSFGAWKSASLPGLFMQQRTLLDRSELVLTLVGRRSDIGPNDHLEIYGGRDRHGLTNYLDAIFPAVMVRWATHALLRSYEMDYADLHRDMGSVFVNNDIQEAVLTLQRLEMQILSIGTDMSSICAELTEMCENPALFTRGVSDFSPVRDDILPDLRLFESLRDDLLRRCKRLHRQDHAVREAVITGSAVFNARTQERLARTNLGLQWVLLALTIAALITAFVQVATAIE